MTARVLTLSLLTLLAGLWTGGEAAAGGRRPNFLLIIADDLCWRDLGFTGNKEVKTPNLDRLAGQGMVLGGMYTPATTCSPSRHALYTGLYCVRAGAYPNHTQAYEGTHSLFTHLRRAGYRVALQGKTHVGPASTFPFEHIQGADDFQATREFISEDRKQPWLLVFASHDPHGPWNRGPKDLHDPAQLTVPPYLHDNPTTRKLLAAYYREINKLDQQVGELLKLLAESGQADDTLVLFVSEQGSSFPYGGKWSVYENGVRVAAVARWPGHIEPGSSSDALMQYVDVPPTFLDAAGVDPTKVDTGCPDANGGRGFDGRSFLPVLLGKRDRHRDHIFAQHTTVGINGYKEPYPMRLVGDDRYRLIRNLAPGNTYEIGGIHKGQPLQSWREDAKNDPILAARIDWLFHRPAEELYDLQTDPYQTKNLAGDPKYAEIKARLGKQLDAWMAQQGDQGVATELKAKERQPKNNPDLKKNKKNKKAAKDRQTSATGPVAFVGGDEPNTVRREWTIDGQKREAIVFQPAKKSPAAPVVFTFHGHGGTAANVARRFAFQKHWPEAVVVYMQGVPTPGQLTDPEGKRTGWQHAAGDHGDRDLKFFDAVLATLKKEGNIDEDRVYATGHSNGGGFTYLLWAERPEVFAAFAPSAAGSRSVARLQPKPAMHVAGENDPLVKFAVQQRVMEAARRANGCDPEGKEWAPGCTLYPSPKGAPFVAFVHPGTHAYPAAAPALIVRFFREHTRQVPPAPGGDGE